MITVCIGFEKYPSCLFFTEIILDEIDIFFVRNIDNGNTLKLISKSKTFYFEIFSLCLSQLDTAAVIGRARREQPAKVRKR